MICLPWVYWSENSLSSTKLETCNHYAGHSWEVLILCTYKSGFFSNHSSFFPHTKVDQQLSSNGPQPNTKTILFSTASEMFRKNNLDGGDQNEQGDNADNTNNHDMNNTENKDDKGGTNTMTNNNNRVDKMDIRFLLNPHVPEVHDTPTNQATQTTPDNQQQNPARRGPSSGRTLIQNGRSRTNIAPGTGRTRGILNQIRPGPTLGPILNFSRAQYLDQSRSTLGKVPPRASIFPSLSRVPFGQALRSSTVNVQPQSSGNGENSTSGSSFNWVWHHTVPADMEAKAEPPKAPAGKASKVSKTKRVGRPRTKALPRPKYTKIRLQVTATEDNLSDDQKLANRGIAETFVANWKKHKNTLVNWDPVNWGNPRNNQAEWNPVMAGHRLMDLELPPQMLSDCVFDPRHLKTEDIADIEMHDDPLVEMFKTFGRVELMEQTRKHWRTLREGRESDQVLQNRLDLLSELTHDKKVTPFPPLANFLASWHYWRLLVLQDGPEKHIHKRPKLHRDKKFLEAWDARKLQNEAEAELKRMLMLKGVQGADANTPLRMTPQLVEAICRARNGLTVMLDPEAYEALRVEEDPQEEEGSIKVKDEPVEQEQGGDIGPDRDAEEADDERKDPDEPL